MEDLVKYRGKRRRGEKRGEIVSRKEGKREGDEGLKERNNKVISNNVSLDSSFLKI